MGSPATAPQGSTIGVKVFNGRRQPFPPTTEILFTLTNGGQKQIFRDFRPSPLVFLAPFYGNFGDNFTVLAWAKGYEQAGFTPVKAAPNLPQQVNLMLLGKDETFNFNGASWADIQAKRPRIARILGAGATKTAAQGRYGELIEDHPAILACMLNILTAMEQIHLPSGLPLDYFQQLIWDDSMKQDRFFGYASPELLDQVRIATQQGAFAPEAGTAIFHPGATSSYKQVQFGEANVQLTFHEEDRQTINGVECIKVEPDIDYYKDLGAHALLEVIPNSISKGLTDPRQVYVLRWMAGQRAGVPEFDPLYSIA